MFQKPIFKTSAIRSYHQYPQHSDDDVEYLHKIPFLKRSPLSVTYISTLSLYCSGDHFTNGLLTRIFTEWIPLIYTMQSFPSFAHGVKLYRIGLSLTIDYKPQKQFQIQIRTQIQPAILSTCLFHPTKLRVSYKINMYCHIKGGITVAYFIQTKKITIPYFKCKTLWQE